MRVARLFGYYINGSAQPVFKLACKPSSIEKEKCWASFKTEIHIAASMLLPTSAGTEQIGSKNIVIRGDVSEGALDILN